MPSMPQDIIILLTGWLYDVIGEDELWWSKGTESRESI